MSQTISRCARHTKESVHLKELTEDTWREPGRRSHLQKKESKKSVGGKENPKGVEQKRSGSAFTWCRNHQQFGARAVREVAWAQPTSCTPDIPGQRLLVTQGYKLPSSDVISGYNGRSRYNIEKS